MQSPTAAAPSLPDAPAEHSAEAVAVDSVMHALMSVGRLMRQRSDGDRLDPGTFWLLKTLSAQGAMRVTDLAGCANLDTSTVSRHVTQLDRAGLIERGPDPDDRRAQRVELSASGRTVLSQDMERRRVLLRRSFRGWALEDIETLNRLLARFVGDIDLDNQDVEPA